MAQQLAPLGARLILVARREAELDALAASLDTETVVFAKDLEPHGAARELAEALRQRGETVDVLVNNAGYGYPGPFLGYADKATGMIDLNVRTLTDLTGAFLPGMAERGTGGVLNVASLAAVGAIPTFAVYGATKAYVLRFSEALHHEMRGHGVHVSALCPGPVATGFSERSGLRKEYFDLGLSVSRVARLGLAGLAKNRVRVMPGLADKLAAFGIRFVPGAAARQVAQAVMKTGLPATD